MNKVVTCLVFTFYNNMWISPHEYNPAAIAQICACTDGSPCMTNVTWP